MSRIVDIEPLLKKYDGMNEGTEFSPIHFINDLMSLEQLPSDDVLDKIRAEIEEYKSRQLTLAIGIDDLEKGKQIALEYVLAILDKYREGDNDAEH